LSDAAKAVQRTLESAWLSPSVGLECVKPASRSLILQARVNFSENRQSFLEFLQDSVQYGKTVMMTCTAFMSYSPFSWSRTSQDLVDAATKLGAERIEVFSEAAVQPGGASLRFRFGGTFC